MSIKLPEPKKPITRRLWAHCVFCGARITIHHNAANIYGEYCKCLRNKKCKKVFELVVVDGRQYDRDGNYIDGDGNRYDPDGNPFPYEEPFEV